MLDSHVFGREGDLNSDVCCIYCFFGCGGGRGGVISVKKKARKFGGKLLLKTTVLLAVLIYAKSLH